mmetsp:Transcript_17764/g.31091  ORF Transcript_17764/g.31091 Transcript_17764/m.31091 type:complete len:346 (+) Transcript_17764:131-1168(+)|eukprot:CAMPEP_0197652386 /NCGR_PEP_ID=MMETSP1338-20131121/34422_1 /TAXON_ID=43686 ORGANISM="Pelagodinium beii, Strain RCC1491" /NCGR_SAMPLE_ID=MMETSP1338 /ASSEMBLY_ACC=CAM_ASM_000754 /LENGTH=345 /DNA_ID=CAMNT_0043227257 /DNA_START=125 /DNA_END=1162 /DNA_ORIENTATION=-
MLPGSVLAWNHEDWHNAKHEAQELINSPKGGSAWSFKAIFECTFWPVLLYCYAYYFASGSTRFYSPQIAWILGFAPCALSCMIATWVARIVFKHGLPSRVRIVLAICLWFALAAGWIGGDQNYGHNMISFLTYQDLSTYADVDPAKSKGQSFMDAGQVYFKEGTEVSTQDMVSFKSRTNFCAAPILGQALRNQKGTMEVEVEGDIIIPESGTIDFWAVGTDCCDQSSRTFTCGQVAHARARSGMRMIREDYRPYYLLAVQEWTARMCPTSGEDNTASGHAKAAPLRCLPARHPLFFTYVEDPVAEETQYYLEAVKDRSKHFTFFLVGNGVLTLLMLFVMRELGFK